MSVAHEGVGLSPQAHAEGASEPVRNLNDLVAYFASAAKPRSKWLVGVEHEKIGVGLGGDPVPYEGPTGILALLQALVRRGFNLTHDAAAVIGAARGAEEITLEPGLQVELSAPPLRTAVASRDLMRRHIEELRAVAGPLGIRFIAGGMRPFGQLDDVSWLPKRRYDIMRTYLPRQGRCGHEMMKRTATVQVNLDFADEHDAGEKMRTATALSSIVTALYAASPVTEGRPNGYQSRRAAVWLDVDEARCGLLPTALEPGFGFREYAEWAADVPMLFLHRAGEYRALEGVTFRRFMRQGIGEERATVADWALHLSTLFPEVRLKRTIELRGADAGPSVFVDALAALWRGLLDDVDARRAALALVKGVELADLMTLRQQVPTQGLHAQLAGRAIAPVAEELCRIAAAGLARLPDGVDDASLLAPLQAAAREGRAPAEDMLAVFHAVGGDRAQLIQAWELR